MYKGKIIKKLRCGEVVVSAKLNINGLRIADLTAQNGFDCLWLDMEHTANTLSDIESQIYAAKASNAEVIVRVPRGSYSDFVRPLELGAAGIMIPHLRDIDDAREIVRMTRFYPIGRRPLDGGNADNAYGTGSSDSYTRNANEQRIIIVQIEDPETMDDLEEIAMLDGIDMIFFGPGDYSHALGIPGQLDAPEVEAARIKVAEVANQHGKFAGTTGSPDNLKHLLELGYKFVNVASDVYILRSGMLDCAAKAHNVIAQHSFSRQSA